MHRSSFQCLKVKVQGSTNRWFRKEQVCIPLCVNCIDHSFLENSFLLFEISSTLSSLLKAIRIYNFRQGLFLISSEQHVCKRLEF